MASGRAACVVYTNAKAAVTVPLERIWKLAPLGAIAAHWDVIPLSAQVDFPHFFRRATLPEFSNRMVLN